MARCGLLLLLSASILLIAASGAWAQDAVDLSFKFTPGEVMDYDVTMSGSGGLRAPDGEFAAMGLQGNLRLKVTVAEVLPDGNARLHLLMPSADIRVTIGPRRARLAYSNGQVRWYSDGREQAPPEEDMSQVPLLGVPLEVVASSKGQILDVVLSEIPSLAGMGQIAPGFGKPQLRNLGEPLFPEEPVKVGDTWRRSIQINPLGPAMPVTVTTSRTLDSYTDQGAGGLAKISGYGEARFRASPMNVGPAESTVTVAVPEMRETITSTEFFNPSEGHLVRADYNVSFVTRIAFSVGAEGQQEAGLEARLHATVQAR